MKLLKTLIATFMMLILWMIACAAILSTSPPTPVVKFPFDVSKRDSKVNQEFRIVEYRSYYFAIRFDYFGEADLYRVISLVGDGSQRYPGIHIPIQVKIYKLDTGNLSPKLIYENTISTKDCYAHDYERKQSDGNFLRKIIVIDLKQGLYRVEANTIEDRPEFSGTPSYLQIEGHSELRFIPNSK